MALEHSLILSSMSINGRSFPRPGAYKLLHCTLAARYPSRVSTTLCCVQHMPILVITDIMCRVGPIVHARCPSAAPNKGALPRVGPADENGMQKVDIPSLAPLGKHYRGGDGSQEPVLPGSCGQQNVYNLFRDAAPSPPAQHLAFGALLNISASRDPHRATAEAFVHLARRCFRQLCCGSHRSMDLFEVVAVLNVRTTKVLAFVGGGQLGQLAGPPLATVTGEEVGSASSLDTLSAYGVFSTRVLAVAVGSTIGAAPQLPSFCLDLCEPTPGQNDVGPEALETLALAYALAKEIFIADQLKPRDESARKRAVLAVRSGACFGSATHRLKALQIQGAHHKPRTSADADGIVDGFDFSFDIKHPVEDPGATTRRKHPLGSDSGPYYGPDTLHDCNHGLDKRKLYGWLDSCVQLSGTNLNVHEQNHAKTPPFLHMLNVMKFDRFAFMVILINETENEAINRRSVIDMVKCVQHHDTVQVQQCQAEIWFCGRCYCMTPLMRSFDPFGRARLTFLKRR